MKIKILILSLIVILFMPFFFKISHAIDFQGTDISKAIDSLSMLSGDNLNSIASKSAGKGGLMSRFSVANIIAWTIFGSIGFVAFMYGKKQELLKPLLLGIGLMAYPYFVTQTLWLYVVGIAFCGLLYFWRD